MSLLQLKPSVPVVVVENPAGMPTGPGLALFLESYGPEWNVLWGVGFDDGGEVWWVENPFIRLQINQSVGRHKKAADHHGEEEKVECGADRPRDNITDRAAVAARSFNKIIADIATWPSF